MATDSEEPAVLSMAQRLESAKRELDEQRNGTTGHTGSTRSRGRASRSSSEALDGAVRSVKTRTPATTSGDRDNPWSSRDDEGALGDKRKGDGGYKPSRGRTPRDAGSIAQANRQNARQAPLLEAREQVLKAARRALTYAGFDLKGDARSLTESEVERYRPQVATFIKRVGMALDWGVTHSNKNHAESDIWMFEDEEADILAEIYLKRARKIGWMAEVARQVQHLEDIGDAGRVAKIFGKRFAATAMFIPSNGGFELWLQ